MLSDEPYAPPAPLPEPLLPALPLPEVRLPVALPEVVAAVVLIVVDWAVVSAGRVVAVAVVVVFAEWVGSSPEVATITITVIIITAITAQTAIVKGR